MLLGGDGAENGKTKGSDAGYLFLLLSLFVRESSLSYPRFLEARLPVGPLENKKFRTNWTCDVQ